MASANAKLLRSWKENKPEKYQAYLECQRIKNKRRRDEKKRKWAEEVHTREMEEERERERALRRKRDAKYRDKARKAAEPGRTIRKITLEGKRRCEMTEEEKRKHDNRVRTAYNHSLSHQKKAEVLKKDRERKRAARQSKNQKVNAKEIVEGVVNMVQRLPKKQLNVVFQNGQTLNKRTKNDPAQCDPTFRKTPSTTFQRNSSSQRQQQPQSRCAVAGKLCRKGSQRIHARRHNTISLKSQHQSTQTMAPTIKAVLIDLSGTLLIDDDPTPGAVEALARLQKLPDLHIRYVTNTTQESKRVLMERLARIGFQGVGSDQVFTSLSAARSLIKARDLRPFFMVAKEAMEDFEGVSQEDPNAVVIGLAPEEFNYETMNKAMRLLHRGAQLIAIHKARYFQRKDGASLGPGPFVTALEYAADVTATVVGKPAENFFLSSVAGLGCKPEECIMIGDDARDDVGGAQATGMKGILVCTGKYRSGDESKISPGPFRVVDNFSVAVEEIEKLL